MVTWDFCSHCFWGVFKSLFIFVQLLLGVGINTFESNFCHNMSCQSCPFSTHLHCNGHAISPFFMQVKRKTLTEMDQKKSDVVLALWKKISEDTTTVPQLFETMNGRRLRDSWCICVCRCEFSLYVPFIIIKISV